MVQSRTMGLAIQAAHQATLSRESLLLWLQWGDFGWHQDSGVRSAIWCAEWGKGGVAWGASASLVLGELVQL